MAARPWEVTDELWETIEPLLPPPPRKKDGRGRPRVADRQALCGILFVLYTGMRWDHVPLELGYGSGVTCWRRLGQWQEDGVWDKLHEALLAKLNAAGEVDLSRVIADASHIQAKRGARKPAKAQ